MKWMLLTGMALACAACSQEEAPTEKVVAAAEQIVAPSPDPAQAEGKWAPRDTCGKVEGADLFRRQLAAAVEARDAEVLAALSAEDVKLDFGGGAGRAELRARLADETRGLWAELEALLALGCSANKQGGITIPWYFDQDMGAIDPFAGMLVTGEDVPVRAAPDEASEAIASISWDVVEIASLEPDEPYQRVELPEEVFGFVATEKLRSLIDYRLIASSRNGRWRITSFVAGD